MANRDDFLKQVVRVMTNLARFKSGECRQCPRCGQDALGVTQMQICVYIKVASFERCLDYQESDPVLQRQRKYPNGRRGANWCRIYQGTVPDWVNDDSNNDG